MPGEPDDLPELPQRFDHASASLNVGLFKVIGVFLIVAPIAALFATSVFSFEFDKLWSFLIVIPIYFGVVLISRASHAETIANVTADDTGLILERGEDAKEIPWTGLQWAEQNHAEGGRYLNLYDPDMKLVDRIPKSIERFELLCKIVRSRIDERPIDEVADALDGGVKGYSRRQLVFGGALTGIGIILLILAWILPNELPRLNKHGEYDWAEIVELYRYGEKDVPKLSYQLFINDQAGPLEDVVMEEDAWRELKELFDNQGERYVEVVYLPNDLSVSFADGQVMPTTHYPPLFVYIKAGLALLVGLSTLGAAYRNRNARERIVQHLNEQRG